MNSEKNSPFKIFCEKIKLLWARFTVGLFGVSAILTFVTFLFPDIPFNVLFILRIIAGALFIVGIILFVSYGIKATRNHYHEKVSKANEKRLQNLKDKIEKLECEKQLVDEKLKEKIEDEKEKTLRQSEGYDPEELFLWSKNIHHYYYLENSFGIQLVKKGQGKIQRKSDVIAVRPGVKELSYAVRGTTSDRIDTSLYRIKITMPKGQFDSPPGTRIWFKELGYNNITRTLSYNITLDPELSTDNPTSYEYYLYYPEKTFARTSNEYPKNAQFDWFAINTHHPTKKLHIEVNFDEITFNCFWGEIDVWYDPINRIRHLDEYKRIIKNVKKEYKMIDGKKIVKELKIDIDYPLLGVTYLVNWCAPEST